LPSHEIEVIEFTKQLNAIKDYDVKFARTFLANLLDTTHIRIASQLRDKLCATEACNAYLQVSSRRERYQQAHFDAFETMFETMMSDTQPRRSNQQIFVMALLCCLDADHQLMSIHNIKPSSQFNADQQRVFDGILYDVAGATSINNDKRIFSAEERKALLQYVMLGVIKSNIKTGLVMVSSPDFFQVDFKTDLENKLKAFTVQSCLLPETKVGEPVVKQTEMQIAIQKLWDATTQQLKNNPALILDDKINWDDPNINQQLGNMPILISAVDIRIVMDAITELNVKRELPVVEVIAPAAAQVLKP